MKALQIGAGLVLVSVGVVVAVSWEEWVIKPPLRASLLASLKDASSAQFRSETVTGDGYRVCGEFNAKNGYGAYTGFRRFISESRRHVVDGDDVGSWRVGEASSNEILADLELRNEVLQASIAVVQAGGKRMSEQEIAAKTNSIGFQRLWEAQCQ